MIELQIRNACGFPVEYNISDYRPATEYVPKNTIFNPMPQAMADDTSGYSRPLIHSKQNMMAASVRSKGKGVILPDTIARIYINDRDNNLRIRGIMSADDNLARDKRQFYIGEIRIKDLRYYDIWLGIVDPTPLAETYNKIGRQLPAYLEFSNFIKDDKGSYILFRNSLLQPIQPETQDKYQSGETYYGLVSANLPIYMNIENIDFDAYNHLPDPPKYASVELLNANSKLRKDFDAETLHNMRNLPLANIVGMPAPDFSFDHANMSANYDKMTYDYRHDIYNPRWNRNTDQYAVPVPANKYNNSYSWIHYKRNKSALRQPTTRY